MAYTISVREDFENIFSIRFHARYITYLYLLFIIYFFKCFEFKERINFKLNFENILLLILNIVSILIININNSNCGAYVDNTVLYFLKYLSQEQQDFNVFYFKIYILIFILFSLFLSRYKFYSYIFSILFIVIMLYNNVEFYKICKYEMNKESQIINTCEIINFISLNKDEIFLYINSDMHNINDKIFYTYNNNLNLKYLYNYRHYNSYDNSKRKTFEYDYKNTDIKYVILDCTEKFVNNILVDKYQELPICNRYFRIFELKSRKLTGLITDNLYLYVLSLNSICLRNSDRYERDIIIHPNGFIYGPYIKLKKGKYEVEFVLKNNIESELSVTCDCGNNQIKQITTNRNIEKISFELDKDAKNVEFLVKNLAEKDLRVKDIILRRK